ncbi:MAG TPA: hypothetical protein VM240_00885 [Verrucomicrobiae bacterium]|nr:hypothetical protein [Verrucomicrobiae bacterium]
MSAHADADRDYRKVTDASGTHRITATFVSFDREPLSLSFSLKPDAVRASMDEFGYSRDDTRSLAASCGCSQDEYDRKVDDYYRSRLVAWKTNGSNRRLFVDVPQVVERNRPRLRNLAAEFDRLATERKFNHDQTLGAMLTFVQAALAYRRPPEEEGGRDILGFFPPLRALEVGYGDCDTKSALLATILTNFPGTRMIGVHVPRHYLVGIARIPQPGDAFIEYRGEPFVLVEPSGPGRLPPGMIGPTTQAALATMHDVRIDPLF